MCAYRGTPIGGLLFLRIAETKLSLQFLDMWNTRNQIYGKLFTKIFRDTAPIWRTHFRCRSLGHLPTMFTSFIQNRTCFFQFSCEVECYGRSWNVAFTKMFFLNSIRVGRCEPVTQHVGTISPHSCSCTVWRPNSDGRAGKIRFPQPTT
jgi:hypothetical protein